MTDGTIVQREWPEARIGALLKRDRDWPRDFSVSGLSALIAKAHVSRFRRSSRIADQTDGISQWGIVLSGLVRISTDTAVGRRVLVDLMPPGRHFGLLSCLDRQSKVHDNYAEAESEVLLLRADVLRGLLKSNAEINAAVIGLLCARLRATMRGLEQFSAWTPRERLAARLYGLVRDIGSKHPDGVEIAAHPPQEALAAMIGLSRQRTNTILRDFEKRGVLSLDYGRIIVRDLALLRACARPGAK